ncbi:MAG: glycosyltransferase family 4 protein, partial [Bacteroidota bacterium]
MKTEKILMVWDNLGDYHRARAKAVEQVNGKGTVITADVGAQDILYEWENPERPGHYVLSKLPVSQRDIYNRVVNFIKLVRAEKVTSVFFGGYGSKGYLFFVLACKLMGIKAFLSLEVWWRTNKLYHIILGTYFRTMFKGVLMAGSRVMNHYLYKVKLPAQMIRMPYSVVDNRHFASGTRSEQAKPVLLCVARFRGHKNLLPLIEAFGKSGLAGNWELKIVGGGPMKEELERAASKIPGITVTKWLSYEQMPNLFASSDFFILPSLPESWGLVVNEAMAAGLPIAVSNQTGCMDDFIRPETGFSFDASSGDEILDTLNKIASLGKGERKK